MKKFFTTSSITLLLLTLFAFPACDKKAAVDPEQLKKEALEQYANIVLANYEDTYNTANALKLAIDAFLAAPTDAGFQACKNAWLNARISYGQSEAFRFYGGPIDGVDGPEGLINAWPMDEAFVDYVAGNPNAGIINNPGQYPNINKQLLISLNELFSEVSIFSGYHAAEFLLWGQDLSNTGPGARPYTDYVTGPGGTAANQDRRRLYLQVVIDLLLEHLAEVRDQWTPTGNYRQEFLNTYEAKKSIGLIFSGLAEFAKGEVGGERMFVALDLQDQEHEHSCFSDNTVTDLKMNLLGIKNVYFGNYIRSNGSVVTGASFSAVAQHLAPEKADALVLAFANAELKMNAIPSPFDQAILNNETAITEAIDAMRNLSDQLVEVGIAIGGEF